MDPTQIPNQPLIQVPVQIPNFQSKPNYLKTIIFSVLIIITLGLITYLFFQNQKLQKQVLNPQVSPTIQTPSPTPKTVSSISIPPDGTSDWKTYYNEDLSFKYPADWTINGTFISSITPKINIVVESKNSTLINECMQEISLQTVGTVFVKKFIRVTTGEMCSTTDSTPREIWIIPSATKYAPGISYKYSEIEATQAESVFDQILSTFKFIDQNQINQDIYQGKYFSISKSTKWKFISDVNQSPATPEVLETVSFSNNKATLNIQIGTNSVDQVLASQEGEVGSQVLINGINATKKSGYGGIAGSVYSVNLVTSYNGKTYLIGFYTQDTQNIDSYQKDFDQIISTFKFQ